MRSVSSISLGLSRGLRCGCLFVVAHDRRNLRRLPPRGAPGLAGKARALRCGVAIPRGFGWRRKARWAAGVARDVRQRMGTVCRGGRIRGPVRGCDAECPARGVGEVARIDEAAGPRHLGDGQGALGAGAPAASLQGKRSARVRIRAHSLRQELRPRESCVLGSHRCSNLLSHNLSLLHGGPRCVAGLAGVRAWTLMGRLPSHRRIRATESRESPNLEGRAIFPLELKPLSYGIVFRTLAPKGSTSIAPAIALLCEMSNDHQAFLRRRSAALPRNTGRQWTTSNASSPAPRTTSRSRRTGANAEHSSS